MPLEAAPARPVLVVMGVSGTGKSTVAGLLSGQLGWALEEGDDLHPEANVAKMRSGHPLTDEDRWPWLERIAEWIDERITAEEPGVITCSALKRAYRDVMRRHQTVFVHLDGSAELIKSRMAARVGHFMPAALLDSQLATLEPLGADEQGVVVDVAHPPPALAAEVIERLVLTPR